MLRIDPESPGVTALLAHYHAGLGQGATARALIARAEAAGSADMYVYYDLAIAFAALGDEQAALERLRRALEAGYPLELLQHDPAFEELRERPAYAHMMQSRGASG